NLLPITKSENVADHFNRPRLRAFAQYVSNFAQRGDVSSESSCDNHLPAQSHKRKVVGQQGINQAKSNWPDSCNAPIIAADFRRCEMRLPSCDTSKLETS